MNPPDGRVAAVRRLEETAVGSRALQRLAELVVRLLGASAARIALVGDTETVVSGAGLAPGLIGGQTPLELSSAAAVAGPWTLGRLSAVSRDPDTGVLRAAANPRGMQGYAAGR